MDRFVIGLLFIMFFGVLGLTVRQEIINQELRNQNALQKIQIEELSKRQRLSAQDVDFIEKLVIEGTK
jgi:hypothetical protein